MSSLVKCLVKPLARCFFRLFILFIYKSSLYILDSSLLSNISYFKYLLPVYGLPFYFLHCVFQRTKVKTLVKSNLWIISLMVHAFCVLWNFCLSQNHEDFSQCFLLKIYLSYSFHVYHSFWVTFLKGLLQSSWDLQMHFLRNTNVLIKSKSQPCHLLGLNLHPIKSCPFYSLKKGSSLPPVYLAPTVKFPCPNSHSTSHSVPRSPHQALVPWR